MASDQANSDSNMKTLKEIQAARLGISRVVKQIIEIDGRKYTVVFAIDKNPGYLVMMVIYLIDENEKIAFSSAEITDHVCPPEFYIGRKDAYLRLDHYYARLKYITLQRKCMSHLETKDNGDVLIRFSYDPNDLGEVCRDFKKYDIKFSPVA
jgi:hypothetical protein